MEKLSSSIVDILLVEDNPDDAGLAIRALKKNNLANHLKHVEDGEEALDFLQNKANGLPRVVLLDLKMPKVDGIEVLRAIKSDPRLKHVPVVVMTSSKEERDIVDSYALGVNAYIVKPVDIEKFIKAIRDLGYFWVVMNEVPKSLGNIS